MSFNYDGDSLYSLFNEKAPENERLKRMNRGIWDFFCNDIAKKGFQQREGQQDMALDIGDAIENQRHLIVEAGVGIGKTFAYIVPLFKFKKQFSRPVIISTSTITLQEQLREDIGTISDLLNAPMQTIIAKGQSHYICKRKVETLEDKALKDLITNAMNHQAIERNNLTDLYLSNEQWEQIAIIGFGKKYCKECSFYKQCFFQIMRSRLNKPNNDFIVCNHDLLIADLKKRCFGRNTILADAPIIVIDEAHNLENAARNQLTLQCSLSDYDWAINAVKNGVQNFYSLESTASHIHNLLEMFFSKLFKQVQQQYDANDGASENSRYFYQEGADLNSLIGKITKKMNEFAEIVQIRLKRTSNPSHEAAADRLTDIAALFKTTSESMENAMWLESDARDMRKLRFTVCPQDIGGWLRNTLFDSNRIAIVTSATLTSQCNGTPEEMYGYMAKNIGFPSAKARGEYAEPKVSPFDYDHHTLIYCADDLPHPSREKEAFKAAACDRIVELLNISKGSAMILFTAKADLDAVHQNLLRRNLPYQIIRPVGGSSQSDTLDAFRLKPNAVLLGTGVFWEGINLAGDVLTNVIIFKLPFPVPDPIITAKEDAAKDGLMDVLVPEMVVKLKQGIGRLIRSEDDRGLISILDPRLSKKWNMRYREVVFGALSIKNRTSNVSEAQNFYDTVVAKR